MHLGPDYRPAGVRTRGHSGDYGQLLRSSAKSILVSSPVLIQRTRERINVVLACMGYNTAQDDVYADSKAWTRGRALECLVIETQDLMNEFKDDFMSVDEEFYFMEPSS